MKESKLTRVPRPFDPVRVKEEGEGVAFRIYGREYRMDGTPLFSSVISQGKEVLASPMRIVAQENGEPSVFTDCRILPMQKNSDTAATVCATVQSRAFYLNTTVTVEFDGFIRTEIRIMPRGYTVREVFFEGERKPPEYALDKLWLEIPLKKEAARYYQMYPRAEVAFSDGTKKPYSGLSTGDFVHAGTTYFPFREQLFFTGDEVGLGCMFESDENWQPADRGRAIECIEGVDEVLIRIHLLDSQPRRWKSEGRTHDVDFFRPLGFDLAFQVTPMRPYPADPYRERNLHIDCFKKLEGDYDDILAASFVKDDGTDTGESAYDRLSRLGVNTLYLHEKWNDLQNSTVLTKKSADRLRRVVEECHARGIRVIPYFGYEVSSLSPEWGEKIAEIGCNMYDGQVRGLWNRVPFQRSATVCCGSSFLDSFPDGVAKLMDEFGFDGLYLDGTLTPWGCTNAHHGCGYTNEKGELCATYPLYATREMMKRLYTVVAERGGTINSHTAGCYHLGALSLCDSIWEGEVTQFSMLGGEVKKMPEGIYRGQFSGRIFGLPIYILCYANPPLWTFEHSNALSLLFGTVPKPNDMDLPLESAARLWQILDSFPVVQATWHPYWEGDSPFLSNHAAVKVSYYAYRDPLGGRKLLAFVGNTANEEVSDFSLSLTLPGTLHELLPTRRTHGTETEKETLPGYGYRIYYAEI